MSRIRRVGAIGPDTRSFDGTRVAFTAPEGAPELARKAPSPARMLDSWCESLKGHFRTLAQAREITLRPYSPTREEPEELGGLRRGVENTPRQALPRPIAETSLPRGFGFDLTVR